MSALKQLRSVSEIAVIRPSAMVAHFFLSDVRQRACSIVGVLNAFFRIYQDIRQHKLLALRAVIVGNVLLFLVWGIFALRLADLDDWLFVTGLIDIRYFWRGGSAAFSHFLIGGGLNFFVGWIVGRTHLQHRTAMVSAFFISLVLIFDLTRVLLPFIEATRKSVEAFSHFVSIGFVDFVFLRLPILVGGICCVRDVSRRTRFDPSPTTMS
jgi:hypothetical protein